jgi:hypothetical protein
LADELATISQELRVKADALQREEQRPKERRNTAGKGGRPGANHVYLQYVAQARRHEPAVSLRIGKSLYDALQRQRDAGMPLRLRVEQVDRVLYLTEDAGGYAVVVNKGGVRINVSGMRDQLHMEEGKRYVGEIHGSRIVVKLGY